MRALRYTDVGAPPRVVDVPDPTPEPGQVVLNTAAAMMLPRYPEDLVRAELPE